MLEVNFFPFPVLQTDRLALRRIEEPDVDDLLAIRSDEELMKYLARPIARNREDVIALIDKINHGLDTGTGITWGISHKDDPALLGTVGFWRIEKENYRAEIGYILLKKEHGKGLMKEAILKVMDYGFEVMGLHSVEARVLPGNIASEKLAEGLGFTREGYFRENCYFDGKFIDTAVFSFLRP